MTTGLVLSGGATRGVFHLGVIKVIQEKKIKIDQISGCSVGSIMAAAFAANPQGNFDKFIDHNLWELLQPTLKKSALLSTKKLESFIRDMVKVERFEDLKIPLRVNATDINTGQQVVFSSGPLIPALLASAAVPGVFPPVKLNGRLLVDGGVYDNIPVNLVDTDKIILSNLSFPLMELSENEWRYKFLFNSFMIMMNKSVDLHINNAKNHGLDITEIKLNKRMFPSEIRKSKLLEVMNTGYRRANRVL